MVNGAAVPVELLSKPYLAPSQDEPEFVLRNIWRLYRGWYDGNPAALKPASWSIAEGRPPRRRNGSAGRQARKLLAQGGGRLTAHFAQMEVDADTDDAAAYPRVEVFLALEKEATSTMATASTAGRSPSRPLCTTAVRLPTGYTRRPLEYRAGALIEQPRRHTVPLRLRTPTNSVTTWKVLGA